MSDAALWKINIDGGARGNPGPAAYAAVIARDGAPTIEEKGYLGETTNNIAEYTALVRALEKAESLGARRLLIHSDSELLVKQMNGEYRVKNEGLKPLFDEARHLARSFDQVTIRHVRREENSHADRLCNEAMDEHLGVAPAKPAGGKKAPKKPAVPSARVEAAREEAILCLQSAAACWSGGNPNDPRVELVWDQVWSILVEHGLVK
jgi:ribonuclease HI